jgi:hypothetical protein
MDMRIREEAYAIWRRRGMPIGRDLEHWFEAAEIVRNRNHEAALATPNPAHEVLEGFATPVAIAKSDGGGKAVHLDASMAWILSQRFRDAGVDYHALSFQFCEVARRVFAAVERGHSCGRQGYVSERGARAVDGYLDFVTGDEFEAAEAEARRDAILTLIEVALSTKAPSNRRDRALPINIASVASIPAVGLANPPVHRSAQAS